MADPHVISALSKLRRNLAAEIADLEKQAAQKRADLAHVNAVLRLFDPNAAIERSKMVGQTKPAR